MEKIRYGPLVWRLKRHNLKENMWDHICPTCRATTPVFVHEHYNEHGKLGFSYLCETCAQKKVAEWLRGTAGADDTLLGHMTDFDIATVYHDQENDEETLALSRWSQEQRRRRLQVEA